MVTAIAQKRVGLWPTLLNFLKSWIIPALLCGGLFLYFVAAPIKTYNPHAYFGLVGAILCLILILGLDFSIQAWVKKRADAYEYWTRMAINIMEKEGYPRVVRLHLYLKEEITTTRLLWMYVLPALCVAAFSTWFYVANLGSTWVVNGETSLSRSVMIAEPFGNKIQGFNNDQSHIFSVGGVTQDGVRVSATLKAILRITDEEKDLIGFARNVRGNPNEELSAHLSAAFNREFAGYVSTVRHTELSLLALEYGAVRNLTDEALRGLAVKWDGEVVITNIHPTLKQTRLGVSG